MSAMPVLAGKVIKKPFVGLRPVPVALVTCGHGERANVLTIAWMGVLCSDPPQVGIGVRPSRHSHALIRETGEFVVNLVQQEQLDQVEYCGFLSGREADKFAGADLTRASDLALWLMGNPRPVTVSGSTYNHIGTSLARRARRAPISPATSARWLPCRSAGRSWTNAAGWTTAS